MMTSHNCGRSLCCTPHWQNEFHADSCLCDSCHPEHLWAEWSIFPGAECDGCSQQLLEWLQENVDYPMCECGSFRIHTGGIDNPQCLRCYAADTDSVYESLKEAL